MGLMSISEFQEGEIYNRDDLYAASDEFLEDDGIAHAGRTTVYFRTVTTDRVQIVSNFDDPDYD